MKKKIGLLVIITVLLSCMGCGNSEQKIDENTNSAVVEEKQTEQKRDDLNKVDKDENKDMSEWGVPQFFTSRNNNKAVAAYINFPELLGIQMATGKIAYQKDDALVLVDSQIGDMSPVVEAEKVENVLPAYFEQTKYIMSDYWVVDYENTAFEIDSKEMVDINGYEMCAYTGHHTYIDRDEVEHSLYFKAYATKLKSNGAFVYWMVLNKGGDNDFNKTVDEYAENMAYTLQEEE